MERTLCPVLVGREEPLGLIEDALLASHRGEGRIVLVAGESGVGKTRLASSLRDRAVRGGVSVMWGSCSEVEVNLPYLPFLEAFGNYIASLNIQDVSRQLGPARRPLARLFPQLEPESSVPDSDDSGRARLRLYEAMLSLMNLAAHERGLLLVIDDLQWADGSTREFLDYLARRLRRSRIMMLASYRSEELDRGHPLLPLLDSWRRAGTAQLVKLLALSSEGVAEMLSAIFAGEPVATDFRDFIGARSEGNPFVVEELVRAVLEGGDLVRTPRGWAAQTRGSDVPLPATVGRAILLRVRHMPAEQAEILRSASALGHSFSYPRLLAASGRREASVRTAVRAFVDLQLMDETDNGGYRFRHALTRDAIYQDLIKPERKRLHQRIAAALRNLRQTTPADLAYHLMAAGAWEEAIPVCLKAAEDAERQLGYREAATLYRRVLPYFTVAPMRAPVLCALGNGLFRAGDGAQALAHLVEGVRLFEESGDVAKAAHYRLVLGRCYWERSQPVQARTEYEQVVAALEPNGASEDLAYAYVRLAGLFDFNFQPAATLDMAERAVKVAEAARADAPRIWAYSWVGVALAGLGRLEESLQYLDRSHSEALDHGFDWIATNALANGIAVRLEHFRAEEARPRLERLRALRGGDDVLADFYEGLIGLALGDLEAARTRSEAGCALARETEATTFLGWIESNLAMIYAALGRFDDARKVLSEARPVHERQEAILRSYAVMRVALDGGDQPRAVSEARLVAEAMDWSRSLVAPEIQVLDRAVEVLTAAGLRAEASSLVAAAALSGLKPEHPYAARMQGRLALANGDRQTAAARLRAAADFFAAAAYRDDEWRSRRALASALKEAGDRVGAEREWRSVLLAADRHGAQFEAAQAQAALAGLGVHVATVAGRPTTEPAVATGERFVTVLYADVRGYTSMTQLEAPMDMAERIGTLYRWSRQEIERHHGLVDLYAGDAIMATFNVRPLRLEHSMDALDAALALRDKAAFVGLPVGIGIATGPVVVGELAKGTKLAAIGETTNLAARLQAQAAAGEVLLSEDAYRRVRERLRARGVTLSEETLQLKGFAQPVIAYRLGASTPATAPS